MSSGYSPPPWQPPQSGLNPLAILNLLQQKQEMEQKQQLMDEQRTQNATEQFLKAVESGMDPEVAAHNTPGLGVAGYNLGLETAKQLKQKKKAAEAEQTIPAALGALTPPLLPSGKVGEIPAEQLEGTGNFFNSLSALGDQGYAMQERLSLGRDALMRKQEAAGAEIRAREASGIRGHAAQVATSERAAIRGEGRSKSWQNESAAIASAADAFASGNAELQKQTILALEEEYGTKGADRIIRTAKTRSPGVAAENAQKRLASPDPKFAATIDSHVRRGFTPDEALDIALGQAAPDPLAPEFGGQRLVYGKDAEQQVTKRRSLQQFNSTLKQYDDVFDKIETVLADPAQSKRARVLETQLGPVTGSDPFQWLSRRVTGDQDPFTVEIDQMRRFITRDLLSMHGEASRASDRDMVWFVDISPMLTEIVTRGPDGKYHVSQQARARLEGMKSRARTQAGLSGSAADYAEVEASKQLNAIGINPTDREGLREQINAYRAGTIDETTLYKNVSKLPTVNRAMREKAVQSGPGVDDAAAAGSTIFGR